jgi:hypothetical protein
LVAAAVAATQAILTAASEQVTHLAAVISQRVYEDVVLGGYTGLHPDRCVGVPATVEGKDFAQRAWLYVPSVRKPRAGRCATAGGIRGAGRYVRRSGTGPARLPYSDVRQLAHAIDTGEPITVEYVATSGNRTVRTLSRLMVDPPYPEAWRHLRDAERVFTLFPHPQRHELHVLASKGMVSMAIVSLPILSPSGDLPCVVSSGGTAS